ncbi:hypothetical protein M2152_000954 [Microbacteriaceae bacterium SG_E_30_P1]|uniref:Uncharacterized protein n=1 Tax=Antiquaquibacter oligotrophicus TaxID=2880260 RepID=A0ABT6KL80_9MICO|nr:hypothetical protein [Antiquaquibacter oligotrophicus]MDH6180772.1 hypothetical protein [Antiquaquibacter oligotrophicus]UDF13509.1 hypothetical protein LH407_01215 [Antiquaquibacter oligotrophicus]
MTDTTPVAGYPAASSPIRTLAVRITDDLRAQLDVIAQLNDRSVTEEIRTPERSTGGPLPAELGARFRARRRPSGATTVRQRSPRPGRTSRRSLPWRCCSSSQGEVALSIMRHSSSCVAQRRR